MFLSIQHLFFNSMAYMALARLGPSTSHLLETHKPGWRLTVIQGHSVSDLGLSLPLSTSD